MFKISKFEPRHIKTTNNTPVRYYSSVRPHLVGLTQAYTRAQGWSK